MGGEQKSGGESKLKSITIPIEVTPVGIEVPVDRPVYKDVVVERAIIKDVIKEVETQVVKTEVVKVKDVEVVEEELRVERPVYVDKPFEVPTGITEAIQAAVATALEGVLDRVETRMSAMEARLASLQVTVPKVIEREEVRIIHKDVPVDRPVYKDVDVEKPIFREVSVDKPIWRKRVVEVDRIISIRDEALTPEEKKNAGGE